MSVKRVLVTGATGSLGSELVGRLVDAGFAVRATTSRRSLPAGREGVEWVHLDLIQGSGLAEAVTGVEAVVHCASSPSRRSRQVDVEGTRRLAEEAGRAGVRHLVYPSIIGIDRAPFPYYRNKLEAEGVIAGGDTPWSVLRAAKFHAFLDYLLRAANRLPLLLLPGDFLDQPIDASEVAERLVRAVEEGPSGMLDEMAGPEVLSFSELARQWLAVRGEQKRVVGLPLPGRLARAFRSGVTTNPEAAVGQLTWQEWLRLEYAPDPSERRRVERR